jgi:hypothetical protein
MLWRRMRKHGLRKKRLAVCGRRRHKSFSIGHEWPERTRKE